MNVSCVGVTLILIITNVECTHRSRRNTGWLVGTKPPGTVCSLNPCIQGLSICYNGGRCTLDEDTCNVMCVCTDHYEGSLCESRKLISVTDSGTSISPFVTILKPLTGRECTSGFVCIHGVCDQEKKTIGMFSCICDSQWSGDFCNRYIPSAHKTILVPTTQSRQQESTAATIVTERDLSARTCIPSFICEYGICDPQGKEKFQFRCLCDHGWTGVFCASKICDLVCEPDEKCYLEQDNNLTCKKKYGHVTSNARNENPDEITEISPSSDSDNNSIVNSYVCSDNNTLRPDNERRCLTNMVCTFGICSHVLDHLECICDEGGTGMLCESKCCLNCGFNGTCKLFENGTEYCNCPVFRTGLLCELIKPQPSTNQNPESDWFLYVVGVCVGVIFVLLVLLIILPYCMWRNRVTFIMRIVHYFQPYEDDDERLFDAFISYKSAKVDEHFVVHTLYPKLEQEMGFKLCMHFRDFVPGETISNNIINAVNNSRRTILLLSPRYIESDWTKLEYQVAQREMLKHRHRIIPIILEDISGTATNIDPNLKAIIDAVTYIEWPGSDKDKKQHKFWERVRLSMPKTKHQDTRTTSSYDSNGITHISYTRSDSASHTEIPSFSPGHDSNRCNRNIMLNHESISSEQDEIHSDSVKDLEMSTDNDDIVEKNEPIAWHSIDPNSIIVKL